MDAREDFDQSALPTAIFARQAMNFRGENGKADILQRPDTAEALADAAHLDEFGPASWSDQFEAADW
jgi:uncharacterized protein CbrC (UPF0167 family)